MISKLTYFLMDPMLLKTTIFDKFATSWKPYSLKMCNNLVLSWDLSQFVKEQLHHTTCILIWQLPLVVMCEIDCTANCQNKPDLGLCLARFKGHSCYRTPGMLLNLFWALRFKRKQTSFPVLVFCLTGWYILIFTFGQSIQL